MSNSNTFFGHPIGLKTLFLTEMWERMSYYGTTFVAPVPLLIFEIWKLVGSKSTFP